MRPVCFHMPCKTDPVNRAGRLDICEQKGSLFGAVCDDIDSFIGPPHAFDFKAGSREHFLRNDTSGWIVLDNEHGLGYRGNLRLCSIQSNPLDPGKVQPKQRGKQSDLRAVRLKLIAAI